MAGVDVFQSPYTPADLYIMAREKNTLEWDRTCRIIEMIHSTVAKEPMAFNTTHPWRKTGNKGKMKKDITIMSVANCMNRLGEKRNA